MTSIYGIALQRVPYYPGFLSFVPRNATYIRGATADVYGTGGDFKNIAVNLTFPYRWRLQQTP